MKALIIVDLQNDFLPGGAWPVPEGDAIIPLANHLQGRFRIVVATQDWHPPNHSGFAVNHPGRKPGDVVQLRRGQQLLQPVHCVRHTPGAEFAPGFLLQRVNRIFRKGTDPNLDSYSGFFDSDHLHATGMADYLREKKVGEVCLLGLATDRCVKFTALDAVTLGFNTYLIEDGCRGLNLSPNDVADAIQEMKAAGVTVLKSRDFLRPNPN